jgi:hypothetical protein
VKNSLPDLTVLCPGDPGHVGHSRGAGPVGSHVAAAGEVHFRAAAEEEAVHFHAAAEPVSEPIRAAVAADVTRSAED